MRRATVFVLCTLLLCFGGILSRPGAAQQPDGPGSAENLPSAPQPQVQARAVLGASFPRAVESQAASSRGPQAQPTGQAGGGVMRLTRAQAEQLAIKNNPRINVGRLLALAQHQVYRETRAAELPNFNGAMTAVDANEGSRIGAGELNAPRLLEHAGAGVTLSQLITDFGRTFNLVASSKLMQKAQDANALATTEDIVLATDQAFYNALQAEALLKVAEQTVATRGSVENQINQLAKNKLKSTLDLSFAEVNLSQAKLLQLDAQNNVDSTVAALSAVLGFDKDIHYELSDEEAPTPPPPPDVDVLINSAVEQRPDLQATTYNQEAAEKFHRAQRDQLFPTISAMGAAGVTPVRPDCTSSGCFPNYFISSWYGAIGVNMSIPIFNGFLFHVAGFGSQLSRESRRGEYAGSARPGSARCAHDMVSDEYGISARQRGRETAEPADLALSLAQERTSWLKLNRRTQSGTVATNRRRHWLCRRSIPVSAVSLNPQL